MINDHNATIHTFKDTGKWYATGRGFVPSEIFGPGFYNRIQKRERILEVNGGECPGLSGPGADFTWVVILDEKVDYGFPLMLKPLDTL